MPRGTVQTMSGKRQILVMDVFLNPTTAYKFLGLVPHIGHFAQHHDGKARFLILALPLLPCLFHRPHVSKPFRGFEDLSGPGLVSLDWLRWIGFGLDPAGSAPDNIDKLINCLHPL